MTKKKLYLFLLFACSVGYGWLFFATKDQSNINLTENSVCIFKHATSIPCPSCGATRSIVSLLEGDFSSALFWNPLGILVLLIMIIAPLWILFDLTKRSDTFYKFYIKTEKIFQQKRIAFPAILLVMGNWIWNIYKGL